LNTIAIAGVGLIGGSFALALRKAGFQGRILGVSSERTMREALALGVIDQGVDLATAAARADLIYLAQPVGRILDTLHHIDGLVQPHALITDAGSTKGQIVATASKMVRRCLFLGGHPMAGKETRGVGSAEADLFQGRTYVLTPAVRSDMEKPQARWLVEWIRRMGALPLVMDPDEHDRVVSFTSHLPQLASTALAAVVADNLDGPEDLRVAGPGLAGTTRLARSSYDLWRDILATNANAVDQALSAYIQKLEHLRENLRTREIEQEFQRAAELAGRLRR
jgi:prephenate dehydrogenase